MRRSRRAFRAQSYDVRTDQLTQWSQARLERSLRRGRIDNMARSTKVRISAKLLVASYRKLAMAIARRRQSKGRPTLSDVLTGEVTKQVMKADQVTREEVEHLMEQARRDRDKS